MRPLSGIKETVKSALHAIGYLEKARYIRDLYETKSLRRTVFLHGLSQQHQFVVSDNARGLCNRIKCLVSSMRLADKLSRTIALSWIPNSACCCRFCDLFENRILELRDYELNTVLNKPYMFESDQWYVVETPSLLVMPNELPDHFSRVYRSITGKTIDHEYDRIPCAIRNSYLKYFTALVPTGFIKKEVEKFATEFDNNTISVHIRSWTDAWPAPVRKYMTDKGVKSAEDRSETLFSLEKVYRMLDKEEGSSFFVSCDSKEVLRHITRRYGRRVISYPHSVKVGDRLSKRGMQEALIDLLLLSKNNRLKVSAYSTFSEVAWWFGGCTASVECIDGGVSGDIYIDDYIKLIPSDLLERAAASTA
jgi:hypothetical protein